MDSNAFVTIARKDMTQSPKGALNPDLDKYLVSVAKSPKAAAGDEQPVPKIQFDEMVKQPQSPKLNVAETPKGKKDKNTLTPRDRENSTKQRNKAMRAKFEEMDLFKLANELRNNVHVRDRMMGFKVYDDCFIGRSLAVYMVKSGICENKDEAIFLGNMLMDAGIIFHVGDEVEFVVEKTSLYRFSMDEKKDKEEFMKDMDAKVDFFRKNVPVSDKEYQSKVYKGVFTGSDALNILVDKKICKNRGEALKLCKYLLETGLFSHTEKGLLASRDNEFRDEKTEFYRFNERSKEASTDED